MTNHLPSSKSAATSPTTHPPATANEARAIQILIAEADRQLAGPLSHLPGIAGCQRVIEAVQHELAGHTPWNEAAAHATRITNSTKARPTDAGDTAHHIAEFAKAFSQYPPVVARHVAEHIIETFAFRPTPAEIHTAAKARVQDLRIAAAVAERVVKERQRREEVRQAALAEEQEDARALAEGRETSAQRRARVAAEARALVEKMRGAPDIHQQG